ncbi:hydrogenase maturation protein HypF [Clostridium algifaecis]|uniref:Carbamoyltransferase n=1 Tax=Clostridium algifaecis TaxID=1472040 RepID=A0ABS4KNT5_9CLOT|nr:carbamoyltransferase HypF [Clostridium algifaecis]MBP2031699.1 hydrogenase maturation protein HypF [Clostridium algifaecis]
MWLKTNDIITCKKRYLLKIYGIVQSIGFRPFVYNKAKKYKIQGWVNNSGGSVVIDLTGTKENIKKFILDIIKNPPIQAVIEKVECSTLKYYNYHNFIIKESLKNNSSVKFIPPDIGVCPKCIHEVISKKDRRYKYAFTSCTQCGPRYSIMRSLPYDRNSTTMNEFEMCESCEEEYNNNSNRRFHSEANCCQECGPSLILMNNKRETINCEDVIEKVIFLIKIGKIIAIKGIGGFHLVCDGRNEKAVSELRMRKKRPTKPLAVMIKDINLIKEYCEVSEKEEEILTGSKRPIVLLKKNTDITLPYNIAPNQKKLGIMMPYTPLHYLLLEKELDVLIMTSGNISGRPMEYKNTSVLENLNNVSDYFLMHNRKIVVPVDDSVVKVLNDKECIVRRGRGYSPSTENLGVRDNIIALGPEQKNSISLSKNGYVYTSQYLGDLKKLEYYKNYRYVLKHLINLLDINPRVLVQDMHPFYITSKYADNLNIRKIKIQHHHAHMVSCMAEHGIYRKVIGVIYDGTGFGIDGNIWGGEFFVGTRSHFKRVGHLKYVSIQGGDAAIREPWRSAASYLYSLDYPIEKFINNVNQPSIDIITQALRASLNCYKSSSVGRLFDAVSSFLGLRNYSTYEGEASIDLENIIAENIIESYICNIDKISNVFQIEYKDIVYGVIKDIEKGISKAVISAKFHNTLSRVTCNLVIKLSKLYKIEDVILSGGVFQNEHLLKSIYDELTLRGLRVFFNSKTPINDNGISFGQIAAANAIIEGEEI